MPRWLIRSPLAVALLAAALAFGWQALTVHLNYGGNWSALFCAGSRIAVPPSLASDDLYVFPNSSGYDGQFYRFVAHDPFLRTEIRNYLDDQRVRYRRILVPLVAWLFAAGQSGAVDAAYHGVILLFVFLGAWWLGRYAVLRGAAPAWGLAFLLVPGTIISLDRQTIDIALAALTIGLLVYIETDEQWKIFTVLMCAVLVRETGVVLVAAWCLSLLLRRRIAAAVGFAAALAPALCWYVYVVSRTPSSRLLHHVLNVDEADVFSVIDWLAPVTYALPRPAAWTAVALDYVSLAAIPLALVLALRAAWKRWPGPSGIAALLFGLAGNCLLFVFHKGDPYTLPRVLSPLVLLLAVRGIETRSFLWAAPLGMMTARVALQLGPQALGIVKRIFV